MPRFTYSSNGTAEMAQQLSGRKPGESIGLSLHIDGRRGVFNANLAAMETLAESVNLVHSVMFHPRSRWWHRNQDAIFLARGRCADVISFLNTVDEVLVH